MKTEEIAYLENVVLSSYDVEAEDIVTVVEYVATCTLVADISVSMTEEDAIQILKHALFEKLGLDEITEIEDLIERFPINVCLQKSASITTRTSLLKFDDPRFCRSRFRSHAVY